MPKPRERKKPERPLTLLEIDRVSLVDKGDNPTAHIMIHKRAEDVEKAKFKKGSKVMVVKPHMDMKKGDVGIIALVSSETAYALSMEGMESKLHKWYVDSELKATVDSEEDIEKEIQRGRSMQRMCSDVERAVQAKWGGEGWAYCKETYADAVIFEQGGKQYRAPFTVEESEGEMQISLGDREPAETVYETAKGEQMTIEELSKKFTSLEGTLAETIKRAERAEGIAKLTAEERTHFDKISTADQDAFLAGDAEFRKHRIEAAKPAPVEKTAEQRRIEQLEKREQDLTERVRKAEDAAELATFVKRAGTELAHLPGTDDEKGAMLRAVEKIADPAAREAAIKALRAGNAAQESLTKAIGSGRTAAVTGSAEDQMAAKVDEYMKADHKLTKGAAWDLVAKRHPDLWDEYRAERKGVN